MIELRFSAAALVPSDVDAVEKQFGFRFPGELRALYLQFNGGQPLKNRFLDDNGPCIVHDILSIKYGVRPRGTLEQTIQRVKVDQNLLPDHLIPFAIDPFGDYYCFSCRDDDLGSVCLFHMDHYDDPTRATEFLAPSVGTFFQQLTTKNGQ